MKKIPTLFVRDPQTRLVDWQLNDECLWVTDPTARVTVTRKWDGTACMVREGVLYRRHTVRPGRRAPSTFEPSHEAPLENGALPGWVPVDPDAPADKHHVAAYRRYGYYLPDGTYELIGPGINGNPEGLPLLMLMPHGMTLYTVDQDLLRTDPWCYLKDLLEEHMIEGFVFYHEDGRRAKIKRRDFGLAWPLRSLLS